MIQERMSGSTRQITAAGSLLTCTFLCHDGFFLTSGFYLLILLLILNQRFQSIKTWETNNERKISNSRLLSQLSCSLPLVLSAPLDQVLGSSNRMVWRWADMEVPKQSFNKSSWDSRTCYPRRAFNQGLTNSCQRVLAGSEWLRDLESVEDMSQNS